MTFAAAEADRRIANVLQVGFVTEVDNASARVRVQVGDLVSPMIPVMQYRSGAIRMHWMPSVGEQVTLAAPSGDMAQAFAMGALVRTGDEVAPDAGAPTMDLGGGTLRVVGNLYVDGSIEVTGDVVADGISLVTHVHGGVMPGPGVTGAPQ